MIPAWRDFLFQEKDIIYALSRTERKLVLLFVLPFGGVYFHRFLPTRNDIIEASILLSRCLKNVDSFSVWWSECSWISCKCQGVLHGFCFLSF